MNVAKVAVVIDSDVSVVVAVVPVDVVRPRHSKHPGQVAQRHFLLQGFVLALQMLWHSKVVELEVTVNVAKVVVVVDSVVCQKIEVVKVVRQFEQPWQATQSHFMFQPLVLVLQNSRHSRVVDIAVVTNGVNVEAVMIVPHWEHPRHSLQAHFSFQLSVWKMHKLWHSCVAEAAVAVAVSYLEVVIVDPHSEHPRHSDQAHF